MEIKQSDLLNFNLDENFLRENTIFRWDQTPTSLKITLMNIDKRGNVRRKVATINQEHVDQVLVFYVKPYSENLQLLKLTRQILIDKRVFSNPDFCIFLVSNSHIRINRINSDEINTFTEFGKILNLKNLEYELFQMEVHVVSRPTFGLIKLIFYNNKSGGMCFWKNFNFKFVFA